MSLDAVKFTAGALCPDTSRICPVNSVCGFEMPTGFVCQCKDGYAEDTKGDCKGKDMSNMGRDNHFVITIWLRDIMLVS